MYISQFEGIANSKEATKHMIITELQSIKATIKHGGF
jgi:hypothetical protein